MLRYRIELQSLVSNVRSVAKIFIHNLSTTKSKTDIIRDSAKRINSMDDKPNEQIGLIVESTVIVNGSSIIRVQLGSKTG